MLKGQTADRVLKTEVTPTTHRRVRVRAAELDVSIARYVAGAVELRLASEDVDGRDEKK